MEDNIEFVTCKICGAKRRILTQHLSKKHNLSKYEYESKYNSPIVCKERQLIQLERNKELNEKLSTDPYYIDLMKEVRHKNGSLPQVIKVVNEGRERYQNSEEGKKRNSEIMINNHKFNDMQNKATVGKLNSEKFHKQESEQMSNLLHDKWSDEEWKSNHLSKIFDGSKKVYEDINNNEVEFRSSWELSLHNYLVSHNINYEYESIKIKYKSTDSKIHNYYSDFYIPDLNLILEVKPNMYTSNKINQIKKQVAIDSGYNFKFITENELKDLNSFFHNLKF